MNKLAEFRNEPYTDFSKPENRARMEQALDKVRAELGRDYDLLIAGERIKTGDKLVSVNPSRPAEVVGKHSKATAEIAKTGLEKVYEYFPTWSATSAEKRVEMLLRAAAILARAQTRIRRVALFRVGQDLAGSRGGGRRSDRFLRVLCA